MATVEIISLIVTFVGVTSFAVVFTVLYRTFVKSTISEINAGNRDIELIDEVLYEKQDNIKKRKKAFATVKSVLFAIILVFIIPVFIFSLINKIQGNATMIGNKTVMVVASGSMSKKHEANDYLIVNNLDNQFKTYDIIVLEKVESPSDLKKFDVIAYKNDNNINVIHRIISINSNGTYTTRGDANNGSDVYKPNFDDVIGRYTSKKINSIGIFVIFLQSAPGIITVVSMIYALIMIDRLSAKMQKIQDERVKKLGEIIEQINEDNVENLKAHYRESIFYKGFEYIFDATGFIEKKEIVNPDYLEDSADKIIKVTEEENSDSVKKEEFVINSKEEE